MAIQGDEIPTYTVAYIHGLDPLAVTEIGLRFELEIWIEWREFE